MPDSSVTIVTVGFMSNLAELLKSRPDRYSPLSGRELVGKKVKQYVAMAGMFPQGREFNVRSEERRVGKECRWRGGADKIGGKQEEEGEGGGARRRQTD